MKTKITSAIAVLTIALTMALNVSFSAKSNNLSDLSLANVEALAAGAELNDPAWFVYWYKYFTYQNCYYGYVDWVYTLICEDDDYFTYSMCVEGGDEQCPYGLK